MVLFMAKVLGERAPRLLGVRVLPYQRHRRSEPSAIQRGQRDSASVITLLQTLGQLSVAKKKSKVKNIDPHVTCVWIKRIAAGSTTGVDQRAANMDPVLQLLLLLRRPEQH